MQKFRCFLSPSVLIVSTILSLAGVLPGFAQVDRSALNGTVTDSSGRVLGKPTSLLWRTRPGRGAKRRQTPMEDMIFPSFRWEDTPLRSIIPASGL